MKENDMMKDYCVFYHSQDRRFLVFYNLFSLFLKVLNNQDMDDFFMMRVPGNDYEKYKHIYHFLFENENLAYKNDHDEDIKKVIFSANPSFLNGSIGESAFYFFFLALSVNPPDFLDVCKDIFIYFKKEDLFQKYRNILETLIGILGNKKDNGSGILLQIFLPKEKFVDLCVYQSGCLGMPISSTKNQKNISEELNEFEDCCKKKNEESKLVFDHQYRILIKNDVFLDPSNPYKIKMFKYLQETEAVIEYKKWFDLLAKELEQDLKK